jgi:glycosyltransferase involved in cell wall biosynthesis
MPKVSVIITTYNRARYLQRAIRSVLNQTFQDFEIVIVDDASTDETANIVEGFANPKIRYLRHQFNRKEAGSRNTGLENARGEYIAFLDDDDAWLPQKLSAQIDLLDKSPPIVGAVYASFLTIDGASEKVLGSWKAEKRGNVLQDLIEKNWIGIPSTVLVRRHCFDAVGMFDAQIDFGLDYDMWLRIAGLYQFEYIQEPVVLRSINHDRMSTNYALLLRGFESQFRKHGEMFFQNKKGYGRRLLTLGVLYCYNGHLRTGRATLLKAIRLNPRETRNYFNLALSFLGAENFRKIKQFRDKLCA